MYTPLRWFCGLVGAMATVCVLGGCARHQAFPLEPIKTQFHPSTIEVEKVAVSMEVMDKAKCKRVFNKSILAEGYQPIQFTITNGPDRYLELRRSDISVPGADPQSVAEKCHFSTAGRAAAYGVAGLIIWPLLIPAVVDGAGSAKANGQMDIDFASKALDDDVITPFGRTNGVVFVPRQEMSSDITLRLLDKEKRESLVFMWSDGKPVGGKVESLVSKPTS